MTEVMNPPRRGAGPASTTPLRTREPRGLIDPADAIEPARRTRRQAS